MTLKRLEQELTPGGGTKTKRVAVGCDWSEFFEALLKNQMLTKLSLIDLGLGETIEKRDMTFNLLLYNESI